MKALPYSFTISLTNSLASVPTSSPFFPSVGRLSVFPAQAQPAAVHQFFALMCVQRRLFSSYPHCLCHHISSQIGPASRCCCISFCLVIARCHEIVVYQLMPFLLFYAPLDLLYSGFLKHCPNQKLIHFCSCQGKTKSKILGSRLTSSFSPTSHI